MTAHYCMCGHRHDTEVERDECNDQGGGGGSRWNGVEY